MREYKKIIGELEALYRLKKMTKLYVELDEEAIDTLIAKLEERMNDLDNELIYQVF